MSWCWQHHLQSFPVTVQWVTCVPSPQPHVGKHRGVKNGNQSAHTAAQPASRTETNHLTAAELTAWWFLPSDSFHPLSVYGALCWWQTSMSTIVKWWLALLHQSHDKSYCYTRAVKIERIISVAFYLSYVGHTLLCFVRLIHSLVMNKRSHPFQWQPQSLMSSDWEQHLIQVFKEADGIIGKLGFYHQTGHE